MIEKLTNVEIGDSWDYKERVPTVEEMMDKINEIIDWINERDKNDNSL